LAKELFAKIVLDALFSNKSSTPGATPRGPDSNDAEVLMATNLGPIQERQLQ
jgi:hypothetical protein